MWVSCVVWVGHNVVLVVGVFRGGWVLGNKRIRLTS